MKNKRRRYLRFVLRKRNADSGVREGVFSVAYQLRDAPETAPAVRQRIETALKWFAKNLPTPRRLSTSRSKSARGGPTKGICWMKPEATEHIATMHELASALGECGYVVDVLTSSRPGYVVYEDTYQIVAEAFADVSA
jgi:hypothetical protein